MIYHLAFLCIIQRFINRKYFNTIVLIIDLAIIEIQNNIYYRIILQKEKRYSITYLIKIHHDIVNLKTKEYFNEKELNAQDILKGQTIGIQRGDIIPVIYSFMLNNICTTEILDTVSKY